MYYLYFGAFDLMAQESFGQLVAGPVNVAATRGHLRAGIKQQGCADRWEAALLGQSIAFRLP